MKSRPTSHATVKPNAKKQEKNKYVLNYKNKTPVRFYFGEHEQEWIVEFELFKGEAVCIENPRDWLPIPKVVEFFSPGHFRSDEDNRIGELFFRKHTDLARLRLPFDRPAPELVVLNYKCSEHSNEIPQEVCVTAEEYEFVHQNGEHFLTNMFFEINMDDGDDLDNENEWIFLISVIPYKPIEVLKKDNYYSCKKVNKYLENELKLAKRNKDHARVSALEDRTW